MGVLGPLRKNTGRTCSTTDIESRNCYRTPYLLYLALFPCLGCACPHNTAQLGWAPAHGLSHIHLSNAEPHSCRWGRKAASWRRTSTGGDVTCWWSACTQTDPKNDRIGFLGQCATKQGYETMQSSGCEFRLNATSNTSISFHLAVEHTWRTTAFCKQYIMT